MHPIPRLPTVLCVGGHDPCGGAGIMADAEAVRAAGAFALTVVTALTDQDSCGLRHLYPQDASRVEAQCRALIADAEPAAIKLGLIGDATQIAAVCAVIDANPGLPVVLDPVLAAGTGQPTADPRLIASLLTDLLPRSTLVTPNLPEARRLSSASDPADCAHELLRRGARWVLLTGTHADSPDVINRLYGTQGSGCDGEGCSRAWPRLPGEYHGSGCTLASAIAARLALGMSVPEAVADAQAYTWTSLARARRTGRCQLTPNRLFDLDPPAAGPENGHGDIR
jgi:hydroxymethylpyrimidine/phosphomethylpyrimidine kinase